MTDRREFLLQGANALGVAPMLALAKLVQLEDRPHDQAVSLDQIARDERFWANIRGAYTLNDRVVNLDNGGPTPRPQRPWTSWSAAPAHSRLFPPRNWDESSSA